MAKGITEGGAKMATKNTRSVLLPSMAIANSGDATSMKSQDPMNAARVRHARRSARALRFCRPDGREGFVTLAGPAASGGRLALASRADPG